LKVPDEEDSYCSFAGMAAASVERLGLECFVWDCVVLTLHAERESANAALLANAIGKQHLIMNTDVQNGVEACRQTFTMEGVKHTTAGLVGWWLIWNALLRYRCLHKEARNRQKVTHRLIICHLLCLIDVYRPAVESKHSIRGCSWVHYHRVPLFP
jgi:hypothetical protein